MSTLVSKIKWSGRKGAPARTLQVDLIDDDGYKHDRANIKVSDGHQCIFYWDGKELFRGIFMQQSQSTQKTTSLKAYDLGIYLANNKDTFTYTNKKASDIFSDCCLRFGIPVDSIADTKFKIPELTKPKTTGWDTIADALSLTYKATGARFYPISRAGKLSLIRRRDNMHQWVIETGINIKDYNYTESIEQICTRIKLLSNEGKILAEAKDASIEKKLGIFQDITQVQDDMNSAQLKDLAKTTLNENKRPTTALSVTALGIPEVITGTGVFTTIKPLNISRAYYVEEDTHTFDGSYHEMRLKLSLTNEII